MVSDNEKGRAYRPPFPFLGNEEIPIRHDLQVDGLRYLEPIPPASPVIIIHGHNDRVVPIEPSRDYAARFPDKVQLIEVDADHDLNGHLGFIWGHVGSFLL